MSRADWELIQTRRAQALADRLESEALTAALEAGQDTLIGQLAYALAWRSHQDATRIVRLENKDARDVPTRGQGAAAPNPPTPPGGGVLHLHAVEPRASRR